MTRKDFELIAEIINGSKNYLTTEQVEDLADDFVIITQSPLQ